MPLSVRELERRASQVLTELAAEGIDISDIMSVSVACWVCSARSEEQLGVMAALGAANKAGWLLDSKGDMCPRCLA